MQRLRNDKLGRILHHQLYDRLIKFCEKYTPEFPAMPVVDYWFSRVFVGDDSIHILFDVDENFLVTGHGVITIQEAYGHRVVFGHQVQSNFETKTKNTFADEVMEYLNKLRDSIGATCSIIYVEKNAKLYEKKFGYKNVRSVLFQYSPLYKSDTALEEDV